MIQGASYANMTKEKYKPLGKCQYSGECAFYNYNIVPKDFQERVCQIGKPFDENYIPWIPSAKDFKPTQDFPFEGTGEIECEAFGNFKRINLLFIIEEHVDSIKKTIDE